MSSDGVASETAPTGVVYLVGAGPGDPRLLTLRAYELLRAADVVAHDELVSDAILALAPRDAERLAVGRRQGQGPVGYRLHPAVLERARAGKCVVRLKCGDPLVFGRGGEEAQELASAGIAFEIVPGISAALGAAAYAGIPLTHRGRASAVTLATGHARDAAGPRGPASPSSTLGELVATRAHRTGETRVLYMAARHLHGNLGGLVADGWSSASPAAYIVAATTADQRVVTGTLADLAARISAVDPALDPDAPALVIVGDTVTLRERIAWFERKPLRGRRVLVARARPGRSQIAAELRVLGAEVVEAPEIGVATADDAALGGALARLADFDGIVFGCAASVAPVVSRVRLDAQRVIAVGREAAAALAERDITPALALDGACRAVLETHAGALQGRLLLVASDVGRPSLRGELARLGADVTVVPAYRYVPKVHDPLPPVDLVVLPSSSAARAVLGDARGDAVRAAPMIAMGPATAAEARKHGATRVACSDVDSVHAIVHAAITTLEAS